MPRWERYHKRKRNEDCLIFQVFEQTNDLVGIFQNVTRSMGSIQCTNQRSTQIARICLLKHCNILDGRAYPCIPCLRSAHNAPPTCSSLPCYWIRANGSCWFSSGSRETLRPGSSAFIRYIRVVHQMNIMSELYISSTHPLQRRVRQGLASAKLYSGL